MSLELGVLINKAISKAEKILSVTEETANLDDSLCELDNFIRLVNVIAKQASLNHVNLELFRMHYNEIYALYDKITLYLLEQRQQLSKELKVHHKKQEAIKSYMGEI
ncbi:MAG: hypothetical protein HYV97_13880 [Bdellovibrio sp.]|nr:hypothetical protein [Bdellovibrio sp.]